MTRFASAPCRDTALLVAAVSSELVRLDKILARRRITTLGSEKMAKPMLRLFSEEAMQARRRALKGVKSDPEIALVSFIDKLLSGSANRSLTLPPPIKAIASLRSEFPNFSAAVDVLENALALAYLDPCSSPQFTPMVLSGPPGIGKTEFSQRAAGLFGVDLHRLQFAHATASFSLGGLDLQYSSGGPGWLARMMAASRSADPFVLLDEIDKARADGASDPLGALFTLWEETSAEFVDDALKVGMNLSAVRWIATCNEPRSLHAALLSRCILIEIVPPTTDQCLAIAMSIYASILVDAEWGKHFDAMLADDVAVDLAKGGPRAIKQRLKFALGRAASERRSRLKLADLPPSGVGTHQIGFHF